MSRFLLVWGGQFLSALGSGTAWFAVTLWVWGESGSATLFALLTLLSFAPGLAVAPVAGILVDRVGRKAAILASDTVLAVTTSTVLLLYLNGTLEVWHLYVLAVVEGVLESLHWVAYSALVPRLVPEKRLTNANGLVSLASPTSEILAPAVGGVLLVVTDLATVLLVDLATYAVAVLALLVVRVPSARGTDDDGAGDEARRPRAWAALRADVTFGFRFIAGDGGLWRLLVLFFVLNFVGAVSYALTTPLVMIRSGDDTAVMGLVLSTGGVGGVVGALAVSAWGGRVPRVPLVLGGMVVGSALGPLLMGVGHGPWLWVASAFFAGAALPAVNSAYQAIWQSRVPEAVQGRVFGARRFLAQCSLPIGLLLAGPVVDYLLTPLFTPSSGLTAVLGPVLGEGKGAAAGLLLAACGLMGVASAGAAARSARLRRLDAADHAADPVTDRP